MAQYAVPVLFTLFIWWSSTGLILYLNALPRRTHRWSMLGATVLLVPAIYGLAASTADTTVGGAYVAFACGLAIWGWHETSFLMGFVTGPRTTPCPSGSSGWQRVGHAVEAIAYHEIAIAATGVVIVVLTWGGANQVGVWTFMILWGMRLSAKLNVFLGVPNLAEDFIPEHLAYLKSYFARKPMNLLFPVTVTVSTGIGIVLAQLASATNATAFETAGYALLCALVALAVLEHWFLVLPLPDAELWRWLLPPPESRKGPGRRGEPAKEKSTVLRTGPVAQPAASSAPWR